MTSPLEQCRDALEAARNGLLWYRDAFPSADSQADDEMAADIDAALSAADAALVAQPEPVAWLCELAMEDGTTRTQFVTEDPAGLRWNDAGEPSPYRTTPLYAAPVAQPLPGRFVLFALRDLKADRKRLDGFLALGNEVKRAAEYDEWIAALEAYCEAHGIAPKEPA